MDDKRITSLNIPVDRSSVVNQVIERITEAILAQELKPGDFLPTETELVANLGASKTSVREAIKMLQAQGVVDVRRGRGTKINENLGSNIITPLIYQLLLTSGTIQEIIDFRMMFEEAYTIMAMDHATSEDISRIAATIDDLETVITENRQTAVEDLAFHMEILRSTHNPLVIRVGETVMKLFKASIGYAVEQHPEMALRDHKNLFEAFRQKNKPRLRKMIQGSFKGWKQGLEMSKQRIDENVMPGNNLATVRSKAVSR